MREASFSSAKWSVLRSSAARFFALPASAASEFSRAASACLSASRAAPPNFCTVSRDAIRGVGLRSREFPRARPGRHDAHAARDAIAHKDNKQRGVGARRLLFLKPLLKEKKIRRNRSSWPKTRRCSRNPIPWLLSASQSLVS